MARTLAILKIDFQPKTTNFKVPPSCLMPGSNFAFLEKEFPLLFNIGNAAEFNLHADPVTTLWKLRVFEEKVVDYIFEEHDFEKPRENTLHNRIRILEDERILQPNIA